MIYQDVNSIEGLLNAIDKEIDIYKGRVEYIYNEYGIKEGEEGTLPANQRHNLSDRIHMAHEDYQKNEVKLLNFLNQMCQKARKAQPSLSRLEKDNLTSKPRLPKNLVLGRLKVDYGNFHEKVSRTIPFPIKRAIYINDEAYFPSLHKLFLRLMYTLPLGKCTFRVLDPYYRGQAIQSFNCLMNEKGVFPDGGILYSHQDMKKALEETLAYATNMIANLFTPDCPDWESYNRLKYSQGNYKRMLEYKVMAFFGLPYGLNSENFELFRALLNLSERCGILVIFAYNQRDYDAALSKENGVDKIIVGMQEILERASDIKNVIKDLARPIQVKHLALEEMEEDFPDPHKLDILLKHYAVAAKKHSETSSFDFGELTNNKYLFNSSAANGLEIPIGERSIDKNILKVLINDDTPHYVIGGASGSGKSNLLHNLIISACWRYSPKELQLYLLDFKMGTEFNIYAHDKLPHASLISVSDNDVEYGVSVLNYLENELKRRSVLFNKFPNCGDYKTYRKLAPDEILPRMLVIVDEFQVLLSGKGAMERLLNLGKQGRSFGMHMVFATQTLRGLDFASLGTQFRGRIALHCEESDSIQILGGAGSNNNEAAFINKPFAILNTGSGTKKDNVLFTLPEAKKDLMLGVIRQLHNESNRLGLDGEPKVYRGDEAVLVPNEDQIYHVDSSFELTIGVENDVEGKFFRVPMLAEDDNNLLIVGKDKAIKYGLLKGIFMSAVNSGSIDIIGYAGPEQEDGNVELGNDVSLIARNSLYELCQELDDKWNDYRILLIIDNCNLAKEFDYKAGWGGQITYQNKDKEPLAQNFIGALTDGNTNGTFSIAIYDSLVQLKRKGLGDFSNFGFLRSICYGMGESDMYSIGGIRSAIGKGKIPPNRASFMQEEILHWFKPFVGECDEQED